MSGRGPGLGGLIRVGRTTLIDSKCPVDSWISTDCKRLLQQNRLFLLTGMQAMVIRLQTCTN